MSGPTTHRPASASEDAPEVRRLRATDRDAWQGLWGAYLRFYRSSVPEQATASTFDALCAGSATVGLVAESAGRPVGLAHVVFHPTTWSVSPACYLEDLYVEPGARGGGAASALVRAVYALADERDATTTYWHTQEYNAAARSLYDVLGHRTSFVVYER